MPAPETTMPFRPSVVVSPCPPPWLRSALDDIEERVKAVAAAESEPPDSFAERAENYYEKRPQLISLLHDLHHCYLHLAHRYSISLARRLRPSSGADSDSDDPTHLPPDSPSSAAESSISFQPPDAAGDTPPAADMVVAELVAMSVEKDLLSHELGEMHCRRGEAERKMALQGSLVDVLESERAVLIGENSRLEFRAAAAEADVRGLAAEAAWMRRRAGELARCVVRMREDRRVCVLGRRIEGLQEQVRAMEEKSREYRESVSRRKGEEEELERLRAENLRLMAAASGGGGGGRWVRMGRWLSSRARRMDWAPCVPPAVSAPAQGGASPATVVAPEEVKAWQCW